ncbi:MAG: hypothetical protein AAB383_00150 [Patescibacteria group bacterium]
MIRDQAWLQSQLDFLLEGGFSDMPRPNRITIEFGRKAQRRLGSIRMSRDKKRSSILINGIFRQEIVPQEVVRATIAHELCHYAHGFCSPLERKYSSPHAGGIIDRELRKRGLELYSRFEKDWTKAHWPKILAAEFPRKQRTLRARRSAPSAIRLLRRLFQ